MSQQVTISSVTANTPVDIYYCDSMSASCVYVATVSTFPFTFDVLDPYDDTKFVIKIVDTQSCEIGQVILVTPTQTPTNTATPTQTITVTPTNTSTNTPTPSIHGRRNPHQQEKSTSRYQQSVFRRCKK